MTESVVPPDEVPGLLHPRVTTTLFGHEPEEQAFLESWRSGRLHHAWLIHGPRGVGKATLAYRIARFLFAHSGSEAETLDVPRDHPASKRILGNSESRLHVLRRSLTETARKTGKTRYHTVIRVDEVRALRVFFQRTPIAGGWRTAIVDTADEMNESAFNAFLKILEEPPGKALLLLLSHSPWVLPPTIRSRCRRLRLNPLRGNAFSHAVRSAVEAARLAEAAQKSGERAGFSAVQPIQGSAIRLLERESDGSPGEALRIHALGGSALQREITDLLADLPKLDRRRLVAFAGQLSGEERRDWRKLSIDMLERAMVDLARSSAGADGSVSELARRLSHLAANSAQARVWAETASGLRTAIESAGAVHIDPSTTFLAALSSIETAALRAQRLSR